MRYFTRLAEGIDVSHAVAQLDANPCLWNQFRERKDTEGTPHGAMDDIWLRFRPREELTSIESYTEPHFAVFYPAWHALPALHPIVMGIMSHVGAVYLGGVLITRIPPGGKIETHHDRGGWHAEHMNTKVYVPLKSNARCVNVCEDEELNMRAGEAWTFNNLLMHSVENNGAAERITLIISMRTER